MRKILYALLLLVGIVFVSGCIQYPPTNQTNQTNQTPGNVTPANRTQENVTVTVISAPSTVDINESIPFSWRVEGPRQMINYTSVHYDNKSHPGTFGTDVSPEESGYPYDVPKYANGSFEIPRTFNADLVNNLTGTIYYRAHALVNGSNYWTDERTISVTGANVTTNITGVSNFTINANDTGFYMDSMNISSVSVNKSAMVNITFNVSSTGVSSQGLRFRGCGQETNATEPGNSTSMQFIANESCNITSYQPIILDIRKADIEVIVGNVTGNISGNVTENATDNISTNITNGNASENQTDDGYSYSINGGYYYY